MLRIKLIENSHFTIVMQICIVVPLTNYVCLHINPLKIKYNIIMYTQLHMTGKITLK